MTAKSAPSLSTSYLLSTLRSSYLPKVPMASEEILKTLAKAVTDKPPFCAGTLPTTSGESTLFFKQYDLTPSCIDLTQSTDAELKALAQACTPATFGRNDEDVLDESYRKAGKMDLEKFAIMLNIEKLGIIDLIHAQLLDGADEDKVIKSELYELNVYEKGSFFKSHKDTPRGETMFGSLVVVFPTSHEGGALVLRHSGQEWTFDSAALTREQTEPSIAYIAFYSDVDHEITVVDSGYRVTLTYNLFFESKTQASTIPQSVQPVAPDDRLLRDALSAALGDAAFLPTGGSLGFGLSFKYPINPQRGRNGDIDLKGCDAVIKRVCTQASLKTALRAVYHAEGVDILVPTNRLVSPNSQYHDNIEDALVWDHHGGHYVHEFDKPAPIGKWGEKYDSKKTIRLAWVTPLTTYSNFKSQYIAFGNEPQAACLYADLCIVVAVGPFGNRHTLRS
ncbi:hypothetical protein DXG01_006547 [Tephrocybe rancida]|nr:hypothetical protein DXG01_006547 [Tephrocybe rancida]